MLHQYTPLDGKVDIEVEIISQCNFCIDLTY